jgi:hypothetical protein
MLNFSHRELNRLGLHEAHQVGKTSPGNGCRFDHHGGKHDIWVNPATGSAVPVARWGCPGQFGGADS